MPCRPWQLVPDDVMSSRALQRLKTWFTVAAGTTRLQVSFSGGRSLHHVGHQNPNFRPQTLAGVLRPYFLGPYIFGLPCFAAESIGQLLFPLVVFRFIRF